MLRGKIYLVLGIGTDIGKTHLVENFCKILRQKKISVSAIKPVVSGFAENDQTSDPARILTALGLEISQKNLDSISPWRFAKAASPHVAGKINFSEIKNFCLEKILQARALDQFLFVEAAGGVMTPITEDKTFLDLASELEIPTLLVSANYLGSISHTLCAVEALRSKKIFVEKIVVNESCQSYLKPELLSSDIWGSPQGGASLVRRENKKSCQSYLEPELASSGLADSEFIKSIENFSKITTISIKNPL